jgi:hypothetical protein
MSSILSEVAALKTTGGTFICVKAGAPVLASAFTAPTSGFTSAAGKVFGYATSGAATTAIASAFATNVDASVGSLYRDKGDRIVFSAAGETIAIFAAVMPLVEAGYEGNATTYYACIWAGASAGEYVPVLARL